MKRFLTTILALLALGTTSVFACMPGPVWEDAETFRFIQPFASNDKAYRSSTMQETVDFWYSYLKKKVKKADIQAYFDECDYDDFKQPAQSKFKFLQVVSSDAYALRYLKVCFMLQRSLVESWRYQGDQAITIDQTKAEADKLNYMPEAFRYRMALLKMRISAAQDDYQNILKIWQNVGQNCPDKAMYNRLLGYYANALYQQNKFAEAMPIYWKLHDQRSLDMCVSHFVGLEGFKQLEGKDEVALLYAMQDYANYYSNRYALQLRYDNCDDSPIPSPTTREIGEEGRKVCEYAVAHADGKMGMAWLSLAAWIKLSVNDLTSSKDLIEKALAAKGTKMQRQMAERLRFLVRIKSNVVLDEKTKGELANEFLSIYAAAEKEAKAYAKDEDMHPVSEFCPNYCFLHCECMEPLSKLFTKNNMMQANAIAHNMMDQLDTKLYGYEFTGSMLWSSFTDYITKECSSAQMQAFVDALNKHHMQDTFSKKTCGRFKADKSFMKDLLGNLYLRDGKWGQAYLAFNSMKPNYVASTNYQAYLASRQINWKRPFERSQYQDPSDEAFEAAKKNTKNYKALYTKEAVDIINQLPSLNGDELAKAEIKLAALIFNASNKGDLWAVSEFGWSSFDNANKLCDQARVQLNNALKHTTNEAVRFQAYKGLAGVDPSNQETFWVLDYDWDTKESHYQFNLFNPRFDAYEYLILHRDIEDLTQTCDVVRWYASMKGVL